MYLSIPQAGGSGTGAFTGGIRCGIIFSHSGNEKLPGGTSSRIGPTFSSESLHRSGSRVLEFGPGGGWRRRLTAERGLCITEASDGQGGHRDGLGSLIIVSQHYIMLVL